MIRALCFAVLLCALPGLRAEQPGGIESSDATTGGKGIAQIPLQTQPAGGRGQLTFVEENDIFTPIGQDQHYTQGAKILYLSPSLDPNSCWAQPFDWLHSIFLFGRPQFPDNRIEWTVLGQSLFTPKDLSRSDPSTRDRPYAGWLYTGVNFIQDNESRELTSFELLGGVVGSYALGRQTQNDFHVFEGSSKAEGWGHQLRNEPAFVASWERKWRLIHEFGNHFGIEFIPDAGVSVGNVFDYAEAGGLLRWGRGLKANWGPNFIRPGYSGTSYFSPERGGTDFGFNVYAGFQGRAVARNIFLDGNTFANSRSVSKVPVVGDAFVGAQLYYRDWVRLGFSLLVRSPEFYHQQGLDLFGSFNFGFTVF